MSRDSHFTEKPAIHAQSPTKLRRKRCSLRGSLILQLRLPVRDQRERDSTRWGVGLQNQKTPAIGGHVKYPGAWLDPASRMKERSWRTKRHLLALFVDIHRHHAVLRHRKVKQLPAVTTPVRTCAALRRYLVFARDFGKVNDVYLKLPGFVRGVGNPLAVWRECRERIRKLRLDQSKGLLVSGKRKYPDRGLRT